MTFPAQQRTNLCEGLKAQILGLMDEEDLTADRAYDKLCLSYLGFDELDGELSDGRGDHGVDYWQLDENACHLFQFKAQDVSKKFDTRAQFGPEYLTDIPRVLSLLANLDNIPKDANKKIQNLIKRLRSEISRKALVPKPSELTYSVCIYFCCLSNGLTSQANKELAHIANTQPIEYGGAKLLVEIIPIFVDDLISARWREVNSEWKTADGKKEDTLFLTVADGVISTAKSVVFFTKAIDLVNAFDRFGYQIFEPNVRCELKRSKVNQAIRDSVKSSRGRREFKHLNNGITLICASYKAPKEGSRIRIRQPGVINGLQTVKSIHDAYEELEHSEKEHFAETCEVLVRLHTREAVGDYRQLVKSTNNQNPMQPRNLRSNAPEQLLYERLFADLNWFYERKEGAWAAFKSDHKLWGTLRGKRVTDFRSSRPNIVKNVDNLELAQSWLSFIGFSNEAIHDKRDIFTDDRYYDLVFLKRVKKHGSEYGYRLLDPQVNADAEAQAPAPAILLSRLLNTK